MQAEECAEIQQRHEKVDRNRHGGGDSDTDRAEDGGEEVMQRDAKGLEPALREVGLEVRIAARLPKVQDRCKRSSYTKHHS